MSFLWMKMSVESDFNVSLSIFFSSLKKNKNGGLSEMPLLKVQRSLHKEKLFKNKK